MSKNSTLKLWDYLLKEEYTSFDKSVHKILSEVQVGPKKETIDTLKKSCSSHFETKKNRVLGQHVCPP